MVVPISPPASTTFSGGELLAFSIDSDRGVPLLWTDRISDSKLCERDKSLDKRAVVAVLWDADADFGHANGSWELEICRERLLPPDCLAIKLATSSDFKSCISDASRNEDCSCCEAPLSLKGEYCGMEWTMIVASLPLKLSSTRPSTSIFESHTNPAFCATACISSLLRLILSFKLRNAKVDSAPMSLPSLTAVLRVLNTELTKLLISCPRIFSV